MSTALFKSGGQDVTDPFIEYLRKPSPQRLSRFIVAYTEPVTRLVRRVVRCPEASRDVVQGVFLRLATPGSRVENVPHPRAYVLRTALNLARNHLRDERVRTDHEQEAGKLKAMMSPSAAEEVTAREALERLYRSIDRLPEPLCVAIHLRAVDGLSYREIALVTDVSVGVVSSRIQQARRKLRQLLGDQQLAVAWANLELARKQGWFPAATNGLSRAALRRLEKVAKPGRTVIAPAAIVALVSLALLGVSTPWVLQGPEKAAHRGEAATAPPARRSVQVAGAARPAANGRPEKPMAPVVAGAETENSEAGSVEPRPDRPGDAPLESEGGETMNGKTLLAAAALAVGMAGAVGGAETGDFDGDGRLSIADVVLFVQNLRKDSSIFAPGSMAAFREYPCYSDDIGGEMSFDEVKEMVSTSVLLESIHRTVEGAFPPWNFYHWPEEWLEDRRQDPLPEDPRVVWRVLGGESSADRAELHFELETTEPIRAFLTVVEHDERVLRIPWLMVAHPVLGTNTFESRDLGNLSVFNFYTAYGDGDGAEYWSPTPSGNLQVTLPHLGLLATGGRYLMTWGLRMSDLQDRVRLIPPGRYTVRPPARLRRGASAGEYALRISEASQVLLADGTVVRPAIEIVGKLRVTEDVDVGWDGGVPPLDVNLADQRIGGVTVFRFADELGNPAPSDGPLLRAEPGEEFTMRVQVRTTTPLNLIHFEFNWPQDSMSCTDKSQPAFFDWANGEPFVHGRELRRTCGDLFVSRFRAWFYLGANWSRDRLTSLPDRPMAYFQPLDEWLDLYEVTLRVSPSYAGRAIPLTFRPFDLRDGTASMDSRVEFAPYRSWYFCRSSQGDVGLWPARGLWEYDVRYQDTYIEVSGAPEAPLDVGLRIELGAASGRPGDVVRVPVVASAREPLEYVRLAVSYDPELVEVEAVETRVKSFRNEAFVWQRVERGGGGQQFRDCIEDRACDPQQETCCWFGEPLFTRYYPSESGTVLIDWAGPDIEGDYPGQTPFEIARLVVRLREEAPLGATVSLAPAVVAVESNGVRSEFRTGGGISPYDPVHPFSPANELTAAEIQIADTVPGAFRRGDSNDDRTVNLSDAIYTLSFLFLTGETPRCSKAADTNDDGVLNISDPISLLQALFVGGVPIPLPFPDCDVDLTSDTLACQQANCSREE